MQQASLNSTCNNSRNAKLCTEWCFNSRFEKLGQRIMTKLIKSQGLQAKAVVSYALRVPSLTIGRFILSFVSIPGAYLRRTSDVNGPNFSLHVSKLLCSLGNACSSKPMKYTFKSCFSRLTSLLTLYENKIRKSIKL